MSRTFASKSVRSTTGSHSLTKFPCEKGRQHFASAPNRTAVLTKVQQDDAQLLQSSSARFCLSTRRRMGRRPPLQLLVDMLAKPLLHLVVAQSRTEGRTVSALQQSEESELETHDSSSSPPSSPRLGDRSMSIASGFLPTSFLAILSPSRDIPPVPRPLPPR